MSQPWFVYVVYSTATGRLYTGISIDPIKDNAGRGGKYTLVWKKRCDDEHAALKLEAAIKKMKRREKLVMTGLAA